MSSLTLADAETTYGVTHLDHLDRAAALPTVSRLGFQGDVAVVRTQRRAAATPVPAGGVPVVRGENGGNTHLLIGDGAYDTGRRDPTGLLLGVATVPRGGTALLSHPEHGGLLLAPGTYELRRQREQADQIRLVQD